MHHFLAFIVVFFAPTPDAPSGKIELSGFEAANAQACIVEAQLAANSLSQKPGVVHVSANCFDVENPREKPA